MKLTKYAHSCFMLEKDGKVLVVDPGGWSPDFVVPENVVGIVVTHEHFDHFDEEKLRAIVAKNPEVLIYAPSDVVAKIPDLPTRVANAGESLPASNFNLTFTGGKHATIHKDFHPEFQNVGVTVDDALYHPGDSLVLPNQPIKILSLPIIAPWGRVSESMDFLMTIKPEIAFPTHDSMLAQSGIELYDRWHAMAAEKHGVTYQRLASGETIEI